MAPPGGLGESDGVTSEDRTRSASWSVDDSDGFRSLLQWFPRDRCPKLGIRREARDGIDAIEQVGRTKPDLVLMDVLHAEAGRPADHGADSGPAGRVGAHRSLSPPTATPFRAGWPMRSSRRRAR